MTDSHGDVVELRLPPDPKYIQVVRLTVAGVAARAGVDVDDVDDVKVAACEAFTNTIDHAYEGQERKPVLLRLTPTASELSGEGGLGLYLAHQLMDDLKIESAPGSGTRVIMTKRLAR